METKLNVFEVEGKLLFHTAEIREFMFANSIDNKARVFNGLWSLDMIDNKWLYYEELDMEKIPFGRNIGKRTIDTIKELKGYLDQAVAEYREKKGIVAMAEDPELKRREEVIEKSNILFANSHSITAYHRYMDDMANANVNINQIRSYAQFVIGLAESIVETQDKYRKEGKL